MTLSGLLNSDIPDASGAGRTPAAVDRRQFLQLAGLGGAVFMSGLPLAGCASGAGVATQDDFFFVQLSDAHWGFEGPPNPDARGTLIKAVAAANALDQPPDFVMFTGDLTHTTDDPRERRKRMAEVRAIVAGLQCKDVRFIPGEHDASLDNGKAFQEFFGPTHYTFDHKGVHFIVVDNVSDPAALRAFVEASAQELGGLDIVGSNASASSPTARCSTCTRSGIGRRATARRRSTCCSRAPM